MNKVVLEVKDLPKLHQVLVSNGYKVLGPVVRDGAIVYEELTGTDQLPAGWVDEQEPGRYRLRQTGDGTIFGYTVGMTPWKKYLHVSSQPLWKLRREGEGWTEEQSTHGAPEKNALLGVRPCELRAIEIQDRVKLGGPFRDFFYKARRENTFLVVVNCTRAGNTCFCASLKTGPGATSGFDLAMTEMQEEDGGRHYFVMESGSERGAAVLAELPHREASAQEAGKAQEAVDRASGRMGRTMDTSGLKELLLRNYDHSEWEKAGSRCLTCGSCTFACPTCFCTTMFEYTDVTGRISHACKRWDSCFTLDFSYIHGGSVRTSAKSRYRQWLTHKFANWIDQFGTHGCVGCGRCITWCPAGIDITAEVQEIREKPVGSPASASSR